MILLDTHVLVWWISGSRRLPRRVTTAINEARDRKAIFVSSITTWEIGQLVQRKRLQLTMPVDDWIAKVEGLPFVQFIPVDNRIALRSTALLDALHGDPADRIIVSTALGLGATLVTKDERLRRYRHVTTLW